MSRLNVLVSRTGRTKAFYLRAFIEDGLDDLEDHYLATEILQRVYRGEEPTFSSESLRKELGLQEP